uniref:RNA helicase n=1 Tax=Timema shepardi TaxID=629360 RepID=A0A7R9AQW7_TIMSH|nr:unnamed protein product [Timema shepardi]
MRFTFVRKDVSFHPKSENVDFEIEPSSSKKKGKKTGAFESMGLSFPVIKGIKKRGYKLPTPIQRKTIPLVMEGRDVVAMARTGSGKTACFLIPLFEKLKMRTAKSGARALILSPTRELALQTLKFFKELGRFTDLRAAVILGGDSMDDQFSALHGNPDLIVATPGRFMHICIEMDLKLSSVEYIVFDEADRLFEMGFGEQLREIVNRLPESRQTLLFSATLPKVLVEFAKAGLTDPVLLRLDVESKLPDQLKLAFLCCRSEEKTAALLCLLKHVVKPKAQTVVFAATKHHVEYLHLILDRVGISNTYIYSNLDPSARKINAAKFQNAKVSVLIVTDIAARGIDIPQLDNVINYNFPAKPKLFVHRVGRCARAGRSGMAFSLLSGDEYAYLLDLHLFLGRPLNLYTDIQASDGQGDFPDGAIGQIPRALLEEEHCELLSWHVEHTELSNMRNVCSNGYKQYIRSRPGASNDSVKRFKDLNLANLAIHPVFSTNENLEKFRMLDKMKKYKPAGTVFEISQSTALPGYSVMKCAREKHQNAIAYHAKKIEDREKRDTATKGTDRLTLPASTAEDINETFRDVVAPKKRRFPQQFGPKKKKPKITIDEENYVRYSAPDHHSELGLAVNKFEQEASKMEMNLTGDSEATLNLHKKLTKWDTKKKKMVAINKVCGMRDFWLQNSKIGKIRSESGVWIAATYKTNRYNQWKEKTKLLDEARHESDDDVDDDDENKDANRKKAVQNQPHTHWGRHNKKVHLKATISELKKPEQILKARAIAEKRKQKNKKKHKKKGHRR